jgi:tRNA U34 5-methylaminomethyl-2-thiouridine-forming methyltransferase MnmC
MRRKVITTSDGSSSLLWEDRDETYHSRHGAIRESRHVFIDNGLALFPDCRELSVLEVGFGTGLNALLSLEFSAERSIRIFYCSLEPYPLGEEEWNALNYTDLLPVWKQEFLSLHEAAWGEPVRINPEFTLLKWKESAGYERVNGSFDVVFFDAFAPRVQPELWQPEILAWCRQRLRPGGLLVTYCAQGQFRRTLKALGFETKSLPGPPGKREMTTAWNRE